MGQVLAGAQHVAVEEVNSEHWLDKGNWPPDSDVPEGEANRAENSFWLSLDSYSVSIIQSPTFPFNSSNYSECHPQSTNMDIHVLCFLLSAYNSI